MKGNERILFVGNMSCLCAAAGQSNQPSKACTWQTKRVVVTESTIIFYPHASFDAFAQFGGPKAQITVNEVYEELIDVMHNPKLDTHESIQFMQDRMSSHRNNLIQDRDSITSAPLVVIQVNQKTVLLMSLEGLSNMFTKLGMAVPIPFNVGRGICLVNKQNKEINYLVSRSFNDAFRFSKACNISVLLQKYYKFVQQQNQAINQNIVNLLQECINYQIPTLTLEFTPQQSEMELLLYKLLIEESFIINGIVVDFSLTSDEAFSNLKVILTFLKPSQLLSLTINKQCLGYNHLYELYSIISVSQFLEQIHFQCNLIEDKALEIIGRVFEHCIDLKIIDISHNLVTGNDQNLEIFLMKAAQLLLKVKIDMSYNQLHDNCINVIESRVLFDDTNQIDVLDLSHNKFTQQGTWRLYLGCSEAKKTQLIVYPLPFSVEIFQNYSDTPKTVSFDDTHPFSKSQIVYNQSLHDQIGVDMSLTIPKKTLCYFKECNVREQEKSSITISRRDSKKLPVTSKKVLDQVRQFMKQTDDLFDMNDQDPKVEDVWNLTTKIFEYPYQVPLKIIVRLQDHVWHKLNEAILIRDHYSVSFLSFSATNLQIETQFFRDRYLRVTNRKNLIQVRIMKLLNFEIEESQLNQELDDLISECHRLDIRGYPLSALIYIKLERDTMIRQYAMDGYDWTLEWENDPLGDAFHFLDRDHDKLNIELPQQIIHLQINSNLFLHPQKINYFELCFVRLERYQDNLDRLTYLVTEHEDESVTFKKGDQEKIKIFGSWARSRLRFIHLNQFLTYDYLLWQDNKQDLQMNSVRHAVYHFNYKVRMQEIYQAICQLDRSFSDLTYHETIDRIDDGDPTILNYHEIEQCRFLLSHMRIKIKVKMYSKNPELPINLHEYLVNNDILIYENLRIPQEQESVDAPNSILNQPSNPNLTTLLRIDDGIYLQAVNEIEKSLRYIFRELAVLDNDQYETTLAYQSILNIIDVIQRSPCPCLLADELYLQIFRYQNKLEVQDSSFVGEQQLYKIMAVLTLYLPPSLNLHNSIMGWLYQKSLRFQLQKPAKKSIQNLITWQLSGKDHYCMPDWLPDIYEIQQRFRCNPNVEVTIHTADGTLHRIIVPESATIGEVMEVIYNSELISGVQDKYSYWIYRQVSNGEARYEEIPLLKEQGLMESMSGNSLGSSSSSKYLFLRRRIYCAWYTYSSDIIKGQHFDLLFHELVMSYINKDYLVQQYEKDAIISIAAILYLIFTKINSNKKVINFKKSYQTLEVLRQYKGLNKSEEEIRKQIVQDTLNSTMDDRNLRSELLQYIPLSSRYMITQADLQTSGIAIVKDYYNQSLEQIKQVFLIIMSLNPACYGTCFRVRAFESFQETEDIKTDTLLIINNFGVSFYEWMGAIQKPFKVYMFEEIVGISITANQMRLHVTNVEKQFRIVLLFQENRALECYTDIISYMVLRTNELTRPLYAYNELFRMVQKENIYLNEIPNRNQTIQFILSEMGKRDTNSIISFFSQVSKVTHMGQLQSQIQQLNQRYHEDERFIQLLIQKYQALQAEARKVSLNTLMFKHFPFHLDCPFLHRDKERSIKQTDVGMYFGQHAQSNLKDLFESVRYKFPKSHQPPQQPLQQTDTDTSKSRLITPRQVDRSSSQNLKSPSLLDKYKHVNDELLKELSSENSRIKPKLKQPQAQEKQSIQPSNQPSKRSVSKTPTSMEQPPPILQKSSYSEAFDKFNKSQPPSQRSDNKSQQPIKLKRNEDNEVPPQKTQTDAKRKSTQDAQKNLKQVQELSPRPVAQKPTSDLEKVEKPKTPQKIKYVKGTTPPPKTEGKSTTPDQQLKDLFSKYRKPQSRNSENEDEQEEKQEKSKQEQKQEQPKQEQSQNSGSSSNKKTGFTKPVFIRKAPSPEAKEEPKKVPISFKKQEMKIEQPQDQFQQKTPIVEQAITPKSTSSNVKKDSKKPANEQIIQNETKQPSGNDPQKKPTLPQPQKSPANDSKNPNLSQPNDPKKPTVTVNEPNKQLMNKSIKPQNEQPQVVEPKNEIQPQINKEPMKSQIIEPKNPQINQPIKPQVNEPIKPQVNEPIKPQVNEPIKQQPNEPTKQQLNEPSKSPQSKSQILQQPKDQKVPLGNALSSALSRFPGKSFNPSPDKPLIQEEEQKQKQSQPQPPQDDQSQSSNQNPNTGVKTIKTKKF